TSGSTNLPKGVINTHRMWCANQRQMAQSMTPITEGDLVLVDWLPWNHCYGGNSNFNGVLSQGAHVLSLACGEAEVGRLLAAYEAVLPPIALRAVSGAFARRTGRRAS
uniref:AMP-binding protein n=1 Tax=uncultured Bradyrhizobium sp. TaxID=199684 RepID=UPI00261027E2